MVIMKHQTPRPTPVNISLYATEIVDMYVNQMFSVSKIARQIRTKLPDSKCVGNHQISDLLKKAKCFRTHSETMKAASAQMTPYHVACVGCNVPFNGTRYNNKYCKKCAPDERSWSLIARYKLTPDQHDQMLNFQNHCCAICKRKFADLPLHKNKHTTIVIDHDHNTNQVRGLLCNECNVTLGHLEKKPTGWLPIALAYIGKAAV